MPDWPRWPSAIGAREGRDDVGLQVSCLPFFHPSLKGNSSVDSKNRHGVLGRTIELRISAGLEAGGRNALTLFRRSGSADEVVARTGWLADPGSADSRCRRGQQMRESAGAGSQVVLSQPSKSPPPPSAFFSGGRWARCLLRTGHVFPVVGASHGEVRLLPEFPVETTGEAQRNEGSRVSKLEKRRRAKQCRSSSRRPRRRRRSSWKRRSWSSEHRAGGVRGNACNKKPRSLVAGLVSQLQSMASSTPAATSQVLT